MLPTLSARVVTLILCARFDETLTAQCLKALGCEPLKADRLSSKRPTQARSAKFSLCNDLRQPRYHHSTPRNPGVWMRSEPRDFAGDNWRLIDHWRHLARLGRRGVLLIEDSVEPAFFHQYLKYMALETIEMHHGILPALRVILLYDLLVLEKRPNPDLFHFIRIKNRHRDRVSTLISQMPSHATRQTLASLTDIDWLSVIIYERVNAPLDRA